MSLSSVAIVDILWRMGVQVGAQPLLTSGRLPRALQTPAGLSRCRPQRFDQLGSPLCYFGVDSELYGGEREWLKSFGGAGDFELDQIPYPLSSGVQRVSGQR